MAILERLRQELDRAGESAQRALDEGRLRLELFRARQAVDRFAQRFGYAVYHAKSAGNADLPPEELTAHMSNLTAAEAEVRRLETLIAEVARRRRNAVVLATDVPRTDVPRTDTPRTDAPPDSTAPKAP